MIARSQESLSRVGYRHTFSGDTIMFVTCFRASLLSLAVVCFLTADLTAQELCPLQYLGQFNGRYYYSGKICTNCYNGSGSDTRPHVIDYSCLGCNSQTHCSDPINLGMGIVAHKSGDAPPTHIDQNPGLEKYVPRRAADDAERGPFFTPGKHVRVDEAKNLAKFTIDKDKETESTHYFRLVRIVLHPTDPEPLIFLFGQEVDTEIGRQEDEMEEPDRKPIEATSYAKVAEYVYTLVTRGKFIVVTPEGQQSEEDFDKPGGDGKEFRVMLKK